MKRYPALVRYAFFTISVSVLGASVSVAERVRVADNLLIEGYYTQEGRDFSRGSVVKFLLNQPYEIAKIADKSKAYQLADYAVTPILWMATTGISAWQSIQFAKFVKNADFSDSNTVLYNKIWKFTVPLLIGSDISLTIHNLLRNRSNYHLFKAVKAYDSILCTKQQVNIIIDHQIKEVKPGWFMQDRVLMPTSVLYSVLKENEASHTAANSSILCRTISLYSGLIGSFCISNSVLGLIEGGPGGKRVNKSVLYSQLGIGIGTLLLATVTSIVSGGIRDKAIQNYNGTLPKAPKPLQLEEPIPTTPIDYPPR
jgi:hypothetical protein